MSEVRVVNNEQAIEQIIEKGRELMELSHGELHLVKHENDINISVVNKDKIRTQ